MAGPRWPVGAGPVPLAPRSPSIRRALLAVGLPVVMIAAALVGLLVVFGALRPGGGPSNAVPRIATPLTPTTFITPTYPGRTDTGPTGGSGVPTTTAPTSAVPTVTATTARQQARAIDALLDDAARTPVSATVTSLARCDGTSIDASRAATTIQAAANARARLLERLREIPVDQLTGGPALKTTLQDTWDQWVTADRNYLIWAQGIVSGAPCNPQNPFKLAGDVAAASAGRDGTGFVAAWNADVARPLGLTVRVVRNL